MYPLDELVEIFDGPHATPQRTHDGPVFLGISSLDNGRLDLSDVSHLSEQDFVMWTRRVSPREGDVVFSYETRLGEAAQIPFGLRCCLGRRMGLLRVRSRQLDPRYLLYAYLGPQFQQVIRDRTVGGSTVDRIPLNVMGGFPIVLPPHDEQERIVSVLGTLDDKIESNRRLASLLETTVTTFFRARFIDFITVEKFEESEFGKIPVGWQISSLAHLAQFVNGKAFTKEANGKGRPILRIKELNGGIGDRTPRTDLDVLDDHLARDEDILFAWSGSLAAYRWSGPESVINQHIFKVIPDGWPVWFVYGWLQEHMAGFQGIARDKATTMGHIQRHHLSEAIVPLPDAGVLASADHVLGSLDKQRGMIVREATMLGEIRDALLPKLISGEIRVPDTADPQEVIGPAAEELVETGS